MITDKAVLSKLEKIEQRYAELIFEKVTDVPIEMCETRQHFRQEPGPDTQLTWQPAPLGSRWGDNWMTAWFRGDITLPHVCDGGKVFIRARTGGETLFIVDGEHRGVFDGNHPVVMMTLKGVAGRTYHLNFEAYAGHAFPGVMPDDRWVTVGKGARSFDGVEIVLEREDVAAFVFDLKVLRQLVNVLDENSLRRGRIISSLARIFALVDAMPGESSENDWRPKLAGAREIMQPLFNAQNGSTTPWFGIIGHSHIDTAWLWPIAETWRKCARTFSSVLNLMEQYPEFMFLQSAPYYAHIMRQEYPGIFERMRSMVAAGRWEPNGAMWVEPDCNIPSGESFVRQLLIGQMATREMFGYTADTLWLPDVFGYSATLPQILRGCYVNFFCTTKIQWNDTTRFPYDMFTWKGIDGTSVIAHYHSIHCWPDPESLTAQWSLVQHKDVQDRRLCPFGFGDGGGGPMAEMIEVARRVEDMEGCPRTRYMSVGNFMKSVQDELTNLPEWVGELYLETHRGTLTSIARIKRGNRKSELALREAEFLCTLAALKGVEYPTMRFLEIWRKLLTNQFHDILPGSSITEVNDETIGTFSECMTEANELIGSALEILTMTVPPNTGNHNLLVVNSLSWERAGEMVLSDAPAGMRPIGANVKAQWIENVERERKLVVEGFSVPPLGAVVLPLIEGKSDGASPFTLSSDSIETPCAIVRLDESGRIISFVDRVLGREVVKPGGTLNSLLIGEDIPGEWDNWNIDSDQHLKMCPDNRLIRHEVVANGPLQLRLRHEFRIGSASRMIQDMVFHSSTPRVDFETVLEWAEKRKLLKATFEVNVFAESARHEIQYGYIERPTHRNLLQDRARFEVCAHKWTDLSENGFGVAILNDCKYGISLQGNELGLTLIKSGLHPDPRGDEGRHVFTYSLLPHACGFSVESVVRPAYELNLSPTVCPVGAQTEGTGEGIDSLVTVDQPNIIVECVKWAEKGNAFVIRLYEAGKTGCHVSATFSSHANVTSVSETNMMEEYPRRLEIENNAVRFYMRPFEIKTLMAEL